MSDDNRRWPGVRWSPETRDLFCREMGLRPDEADAVLEAQDAVLAAEWALYRARHPRGSLRDFALRRIEEAAYEVALELGAGPDLARRLARRTRAGAATRQQP